MTYTIDLVEAADLSVIATIQWSALRDNPLIQTLYPGGPTPELAEFTRASYERASTYPSVRIVKAVDDETGQIVAFAKWIIPKTSDRQTEEAASDDEANKDNCVVVEWGDRDSKMEPSPPRCYTRALDDWNSKIAKMRKGIIGHTKHSCPSPKHSLSCYLACYSTNLYVLDILHTHPSQQGKGAGASLLQWGTERADEVGAHCYVETPVAGYSLFEKAGFQTVTEMSIDLGRYKDGLTHYKHDVMVRPPHGLSQQNQPPPVPLKDRERLEEAAVEEESVWDTSECDDDESPTLQYTAEAKMLELRSSNSTGSPRLSSVAAMRASSSTRDLQSSTSTSSRLHSSLESRRASSIKDLSSSLSQEQPATYERTSMRDIWYAFSTGDLHEPPLADTQQAVR